MRKALFTSGFAIASVLGAGAAVASAQASLPPQQHQNGVAFVTGGVGAQEAQAFKRASANYPVALEMVERIGKRDEFTAGAKVKLLDAKGKTVLSTTAEGPFLLVKVPNGRYTVTASYEGKTIKRNLSVDAKAHHTTVLEWKSA